MKNKELNSIREKIVKGMKVSAKKLVKSKKNLGQKLVISENGKIKVINPKDLKQNTSHTNK